MSLLLRPATAADVDAVARIWGEGWPDGHLGHVPDALVAVRTPDSFAARVRVADSLVAELDGVVVGFTMLAADEVEQVYVDRSARGGGVAGRLLAAAADRVAAAGHESAWLAVVPGNARARRFYEREGWTDEGAFTHAVPVPGGTVDVLCHRLTLALPRPGQRER
ncbi:GNAT family N-acetyltransferase [Pseudactinotalea suaedae]|uniref:GNAT family N-acetyltransferase n=1 Tax=Pseudactinotalea suaedae TaxID=1524924 RepID=UPI0012E19767|nr:GNAT family N-acetyltransferase [Pseudactinotalea suaedae]